jgi:hypothetical protein
LHCGFGEARLAAVQIIEQNGVLRNRICAIRREKKRCVAAADTIVIRCFKECDAGGFLRPENPPTRSTRIAMTRTWRVGLLWALAALAQGGCDKRVHDSPPPAGLFTDATRSAGLEFRHVNGMTGDYHFAEMMGSGVALLDYDGDGDLDILVLQGGKLPTDSAPSNAGLSLRLFRNDMREGAAGDARLKFTDVTESSGLSARGYAMGVAIGDFDNDGYPDIFVTHFGAPNVLLRNNGNGTFTDVTAKAGVAGDGAWGMSATFFDFDRDGNLDLYVTNYVDFTMKGHKACFAPDSSRDYCSPAAYKPVPGKLYRNRGDGTFEDVSKKSGITAAYGSALGVVAADLNDDGWPDIYVANDGNANQLWINRRDGTFRNEADARGCALNSDGAAEAGMGVDIADMDGDGRSDIFITHLTREKNTLYRNLGSGFFEDASTVSGLAAPSIPFTGFGVGLVDFDNDGWLDVVTVNGAVQKIEEQARNKDPLPLHQTKQLYRNVGAGRFVDVSSTAGDAFRLSEVGRGLAVGDVDNDGDVDFVVTNNNGPLRLFLNNAGNAQPWVGLRLMTGKRDALGAVVKLVGPSGTIVRRSHSDGSYLSASDPRVLIGLGKGDSIKSLLVLWPDGTSEEFAPPALRKYTTIREGSGVRIKGSP